MFAEPPDHARPRVWWHWMDGNIDPEGVRLDLEWMARVGIAGAMMFTGSIEGHRHVPEPVRLGSPAWREAVRTASTTARRLGLELAMATSAGWSATGAPWVRPEDAMNKLVFGATVVNGGRRVQVPLPRLPVTTGPYQDVRGGHRTKAELGRDVAVVAFPDAPHHEPLGWERLELSHSVPNEAVLHDGRFGEWLELPREPDAASEAWVTVRYDSPVTVRAVTVGLPSPVGFGSPPPATATLEARADGDTFAQVVELTPTTSPVRSRSFAPVTGTAFRLFLRGDPVTAAMPPLADGVAPALSAQPVSFRVSELQLWADGRISAAEEKAGYAAAPDYYALDTPAAAVVSAVDPATVHDLTSHVDGEGNLDWEAPAGRWRVLRLGTSLTGATNGPALPEETGLEVDKLDSGRVRAYLDGWLGQYRDALGGEDLGHFTALLSDSIEAGSQNWTDAMPTEFRRRTGYGLTPWLPALTGWVVGSAEESDRFLWDFRAVIGGLYAEEYYATLRTVAHEHGLALYAEALEDRRPQLGDDLAMRTAADIPMGAMWTHDPESGPLPTYVADLKGASSVSHVHGKSHTASEAFTTYGRPWAHVPADLKPVADLQLCLGVTRFCIHTSPHQPASVRGPGVAMASVLGQTFSRNETWAELAGPWVDYLARCCLLLNVGRPLSRVAYLPGQEAPVTGLFGDRFQTDVPRGIEYDYIDGVGLDRLVPTGHGSARSPGGAVYEVILLGGSSHRLTVGMLTRLVRLAAAGVMVIGDHPESSPSLADDPTTWTALVERLWGAHDAGARAGRLGGAGELPDLAPDWVAPEPLDLVGRALPHGRLYLLRNPTPVPVQAVVSVAPGETDATHASWWDPVTARRHDLRASPDGSMIAVEVSLAPYGSGFVVTGQPPCGPVEAERAASVTFEDWALSVPGRPDQRLAALKPWTELADLAGRTGPVSYVATMTVATGRRRVVDGWLDLGIVHGVARVFLDRQEVGIAWTAPYRVPVTLDQGAHRVEVQVTAPWRNELVARARRNEASPYLPDAAYAPAGLRGPVTLVV